jgi:hypothetical protein
MKIVITKPSDITFEDPLAIGFSVTGSSGAPDIYVQHSVQKGFAYRSSARRFEISVDADVAVNGSAVNSDYGITLTMTSGGNANAGFALAGYYIAQEVNSISATF